MSLGEWVGLMQIQRMWTSDIGQKQPSETKSSLQVVLLVGITDM